MDRFVSNMGRCSLQDLTVTLTFGIVGILHFSSGFTIPHDSRQKRQAEIPVVVVDSPPEGVNLTGCVVDRQSGHCCIDKVDQVSSPVTDPVLECLTHHEEICHTSYVTEFLSKQDKDCNTEYEKKCRIIIEKKEYKETVSRCMKPLQRVCPAPSGGSVVERIRRDSDHSLHSLADQLDDTPAGPGVSQVSGVSQVAGVSLEAGGGCSLYHERICRTERSLSLASVLGSDCERVPVRLCAEDCEVREGPVTCRTVPVTTEREQPEEKCQIRPRTTCRTVRRLQPHLVPQTSCSTNPREICHIKFLQGPDQPEAQPLIQRFCLRQNIEENIILDLEKVEKISPEVPSQINQTGKYVGEETSERARKLEFKEFSSANFLPIVCADKGECSPDKITPDSNDEEKDGEPEENPTTESIIELEEKNPDESDDTEVTLLMEEYAAAAASDVVTTESPLLSGWEEIQTTTQTPNINWQYQHHGDQDEARTESPELEITTEVVEEYQAEIPTLKELGEELLPYEGVVFYPGENEVEQTTAVFIPNGEKELLEVLPTKEPIASDSNFQSTFSLETTTEVTENHNNYYQEEVTTVPPKLPEKENKMKSKSIFPFVATSYGIIRPIATYGLDLLSY